MLIFARVACNPERNTTSPEPNISAAQKRARHTGASRIGGSDLQSRHDESDDVLVFRHLRDDLVELVFRQAESCNADSVHAAAARSLDHGRLVAVEEPGD